jgi:hypothetical protein
MDERRAPRRRPGGHVGIAALPLPRGGLERPPLLHLGSHRPGPPGGRPDGPADVSAGHAGAESRGRPIFVRVIRSRGSRRSLGGALAAWAVVSSRSRRPERSRRRRRGGRVVARRFVLEQRPGERVAGHVGHAHRESAEQQASARAEQVDGEVLASGRHQIWPSLGGVQSAEIFRDTFMPKYVVLAVSVPGFPSRTRRPSRTTKGDDVAGECSRGCRAAPPRLGVRSAVADAPS